MKQDGTIPEYFQIGLPPPEEFYAVRMGLVESPPNGRRDLSLEALKMRERKTVPFTRIAAPGGSDMDVAVLAAAALKFLRKARRGTENYGFRHSELAHPPYPSVCINTTFL